MCTVIDLKTRNRRDTDKPTLIEFLTERSGGPFMISDGIDPDWQGETISLEGFAETVGDYERLYGPIV